MGWPHHRVSRQILLKEAIFENFKIGEYVQKIPDDNKAMLFRVVLWNSPDLNEMSAGVGFRGCRIWTRCEKLSQDHFWVLLDFIFAQNLGYFWRFSTISKFLRKWPILWVKLNDLHDDNVAGQYD